MWRELLEVLGQGDEQARGVRKRLRRLRGRAARLELVPYRGYGTGDQLQVSGRVLVQPKKQLEDDITTWENVLAMYRRFASEEVPNVRVRGQFGDIVQEGMTDEEGYFSLQFDAEDGAFAPGWHTIGLTLPDLPSASDEAPIAEGAALRPSPDATFGVISDVDDTVLQTHATSLRQMVSTTLLNSAAERLPFTGVAEFYQALHAGPSGDDENPIFYLSSSPWNLYDLLIDFMALNGIPKGPLILQDYGFDNGKVLKLSHAQHKLVHLRELLDLYPTFPFVLIGDSGEHDPELYAQIIGEYPGRIRAVYIRDVSDARRDAAVTKLSEQAATHDVALVLVPDSAAAAAHAAHIGLIHPEAVAAFDA
jgi:phosphatidate phosphatase APP1